MNFPTIDSIDPVLQAIADRDEFVVAERAGYTVLDYRYALVDSFDDPLRRECRGLKFAAGQIIARPFHKFFNFGEKPETQLAGGVLNFSEPHIVTEKMDGSMIHQVIVADRVRFMTRMGITDVAIEAERLMTSRIELACRFLAQQGVTAMFEYIGPENRIVEAYAEPELVLLAMRGMRSGLYVSRAGVKHYAEMMGVRVSPRYPAFRDMADIQAIYERSTGGEGVVLQFDKGLFVKIKTEEYRRLHRLRDDVAREHDLVRLILDGAIDDAMPLFDEATQDEVLGFAASVHEGIGITAARVQRLVDNGAHLDQRAFAVDYLSKVFSLTPAVRSMAFLVRKLGRPAEEVVREFVLEHTGNSASFDKARPLLGGAAFEGVVQLDREAA